MIALHSLALALVLPFLAVPAPESSTPALTEPGVLLTFDDTHVNEWVEAIPLLERYGAKATFFVTRFDTLTPAQLDGLRQLEKAGHAIGCHGLRHIKAAEYLKTGTVADYLEKEITPALESMKAAGFSPASFAYPSSNNNGETDAALLKIFRHLRTGTGVKEGQRLGEMDILFTPLDKISARGCLTGKGIDRIGYPGNEDALAQLLEAMDRAAAQGECLTLYAHNIAESSKSHHIRPATLEKILDHGKQLGLRFYTFDDLP